MIKVNKKMLKQFLEIMKENGEFIFGDETYLKQQLETCLNTQGYWSGTSIRVFYNEYTKEFTVGSRW